MIEPDLALAARLFCRLQEIGSDGVGITRDSYGPGEQRAHELIADVAQKLGLLVRRDAALNLYVTLPGRNRDAPLVMTGSHLDSVPRGGNYDGAAGVVAGLSILSAWVRAGVRPAADVCVMSVRAEESAWFPVSYVGSKSAFGVLDEAALDTRRSDTQRTLAEHLASLGGNPQRLAAGEAALDPRRIACFVELHIEQGPVLTQNACALGVVTGICGSLRYRSAQVVGQYAHSGATPRAHRHDAVVAVASLIVQLQQDWQRLEAEGNELTITFGQIGTDAMQADFSKVCGDVRFCVDMRSRHPESLQRMDALLREAVAEQLRLHGVRFDLGAVSGSQPAAMDERLQTQLERAAQSLGVATCRLPSGAGHDAATFANQGIATAMLFVRNANGSHNPQEALAMADFAVAARTLEQFLAIRSGLRDEPAASSCKFSEI